MYPASVLGAMEEIYTESSKSSTPPARPEGRRTFADLVILTLRFTFVMEICQELLGRKVLGGLLAAAVLGAAELLIEIWGRRHPKAARSFAWVVHLLLDAAVVFFLWQLRGYRLALFYAAVGVAAALGGLWRFQAVPRLKEWGRRTPAVMDRVRAWQRWRLRRRNRETVRAILDIRAQLDRGDSPPPWEIYELGERFPVLSKRRSLLTKLAQSLGRGQLSPGESDRHLALLLQSSAEDLRGFPNLEPLRP